MKEQIEAILADVPHKVNKVGNLWQVSIGGTHAGARENGRALARDLLARYRREVLEAPTRAREPRDPVYVNDPALMEELQRLRTADKARTAEDALMRGLDKLEETDARLRERAAEPEPAPEPETAPEGVEKAFKEAGIDWRSNHEGAHKAAIAKFAHYKNAAEYARVNKHFEGRSAEYWEARAEGMNEAAHWIRARKVETL
jgi:hypothetical protein